MTGPVTPTSNVSDSSGCCSAGPGPVATPVATIAAPPFTLSEAPRALSMRTRWAGTTDERTAAIYSRDAVSFFGDLLPVTEVTAALVDGWRQRLQTRGNKPSAINRKVAALRAMLCDAHLYGYLQTLPRMPRQLRVSNTRDRVISDDERDRFCLYFRQLGEPAATDLLIFLLETACRWGETERLKGQDVDLAGGRVTLLGYQERQGTLGAAHPPCDRCARGSPAGDAWSAHLGPYRYRRHQHLFSQARAALGLAEDRALRSTPPGTPAPASWPAAASRCIS